MFRSRSLQTRSTSPNASSFTSAIFQRSGISLNVLKVTYKMTVFLKTRRVYHSWLASLPESISRYPSDSKLTANFGVDVTDLKDS